MSGDNSLRVPRREILSDHVYSQLKSWIMNSQVPPGERLNIEDLARRLDVSPTPVREALARLESEELTVKHPLRGYTTTDLLDPQQITELYDLRLLLEVPSAGRAARILSDEQAASLQFALDRAPDAADDDVFGSYRAVVEHDARLHEMILDFAGNEQVTHAYLRTHCHLHLYRLMNDGRYQEYSTAEHRRLVAALVARDPDAAETAMRAHLEAARDRVLADLALVAV